MRKDRLNRKANNKNIIAMNKILSIKKYVVALVVPLFTVGHVWAFDFSALSSSGHRLYYTIVSDVAPRTVKVVAPADDRYYYGVTWDGYTKPTGNVVVPDTVTYGQNTYTVIGLKNKCFKECDGIVNISLPATIDSIGENAFYYCTALTSIVIPNSVKAIGEAAFYYCAALQSVTLSDSLRCIGSSVFNSCWRLTSISIPSSVDSICDAAFGGTGISSITIPSSVKFIGGSAFRNTYNLASISLPSSIRCIQQYAFEGSAYYNNSANWVDSTLYISNHLIKMDKVVSGTLALPAGTIGIADNAIASADNIEALSLPSSLKYIGNNAFANSYILTSVNLPSGLERIGNRAFSGCLALENVSFGSSLKHIGEYAFENCNLLRTIEIPYSLQTIGNGVFYTCDNLDTVIWNAPNVKKIGWNNNHYDDLFDQCNNFKTLIIGDSIRNISDNMFQSITTLQNVLIGNNVDSIGNSAFSGCNRLASVYIPNSATYIGRYSFQNCDSLRYVEIPINVEEVAERAFNSCDSLHTVVWNAKKAIMNASNSYGNNVFQNCNALKLFIIGDSVRYISDYALRYMHSLDTIIVRGELDSIGKYAFNSINGLDYLSLEKGMSSLIKIGEGAFDNCKGFKVDSLILGNRLVHIGDRAFYNCDSIRYVYIPHMVDTLSQDAFKNCDSIHTVVWNTNSNNAKLYDSYNSWDDPRTFPHVRTFVFGDSVRNIPYRALYDSDSLHTVILGNNVDTIGDEAFSRCYGLRNMYVGNATNLVVIGSNAFYNCYSLRSEGLADAITNSVSVGANAFRYCSLLNIDTLRFSNNLKYIGGDAFHDMDSLRYLEIPYSMDTIGNSAFENCDNLTTVVWNSLNAMLIYPNSYGYYDYYDDGIFHASKIKTFVFGDSVRYIAVQALTYQDSLETVVLSNNLDSIGEKAFYECSNLKNIAFGNSINTLVKIGKEAFGECPSMEVDTLRFGNRLKFIGGYAFQNCDGIKYLEIPYSLDTIENGAFAYCDSLTTVVYNKPNTNDLFQASKIKTFVFGDSVRYIAEEVFEYNTSLETVVLSNNLDSIGEKAFYQCHNLRNITFGNSLNTLVKIDENAFYNCHDMNIDTLRLGNRLKFIGGSAFQYCNGIKYVEIPHTIDTIGNEIFEGCDSLKTVVWNNPRMMPYNAVWDCGNIETFVFGDSITTLPQNTMEGSSSSSCRTNIRKMVFGSRLASIASDAFNYVWVDTIVCKANVPPTLGNYYSLPNYAMNSQLLIVPCESTQAYLANTDWYSHFYSNIVGDVHISGNADKLAVNNATYGHVDYDCSTGQMTAVPNYGYHFVQWNDGNTQNPRTASLAGNVMYTAIFAKNVYTISLTNTTQGVLTGAGQYEYLDTITISATANYGYTFLRWNDGDTNATRQVVVRENRVYAATFTPKLYTINVVSNDTALGSVSGGGLFAYNTTQTITGTPTAFEYCLLRWSDGNTDNPRTITVTCDTTYYAIFGEKPTYTITVLSSDSERGSVSGSGSHLHGTNVTIRANANTGYHFARWNDGNTQNPRNIQLLKDSTFTAIFEPNTYTITTGVYNNYNDRGSVTGGGVFEYKATITLSVTANYGYHFEKWTDGVTSSTRTEVVTADKKYIAVFNPNTYALTLSSANTAMGTVAGAGSYEYGNEVVIRANSNTGYFFDCWSDGNRDNPRTIKITADLSLTASFTDTYIGIKDADEELETLALYPNPTTGMITLNRTDVQKIEVLDMMGRVVTVCENSNVVNITALTKGYYTLRITTDKGVAVRKVLKE